MSRIFIGQRVRIVSDIWDGQGTPPIGREGRVIGRGWHGYAWSIDVAGYEYVLANSDELEPILPDGHRLGECSLTELVNRCKRGEGVPA